MEMEGRPARSDQEILQICKAVRAALLSQPLINHAVPTSQALAAAAASSASAGCAAAALLQAWRC